MARSIEQMTATGQAKLARKATSMTTSWNAAKSRMTAGFQGVGFGPTRTANYNAGIQAATHRNDPDKWARNWAAKMRE